MVTHRITVRGRRLSGVPFSVVQGCRSADALELDLDGDFDGADMDAQLPGVEERLSSLELRVAALEAGTAPTEPSDEEWPEWVKPTSKDTMYNKDDKVSCDGRRFICRKNNVTTKPTEDSKSWEEQA